jgi:hypothetical protein
MIALNKIVYKILVFVNYLFDYVMHYSPALTKLKRQGILFPPYKTHSKAHYYIEAIAKYALLHVAKHAVTTVLTM